MSIVQKISAKVATFAAVLAVGALSSNVAQASIITGSVTGTWDSNFGQGANANVGDAFTANYSYDDAALTPFSGSAPGQYQASGYHGSLLSLMVNSGSYNHNFDLPNGSSTVSFENFTGLPGSFPSFNYFNVSAFDYSAPGYNNFFTYTVVGENADGTPLNERFAKLYTQEEENLGYPNGVYTYNNVKFTPDPTATAVPTPALLPGLIGMGVAAYRKRKGAGIEQPSAA